MRYSSGSFVDFSRLPITESSRVAQHSGPTATVAVISRDPTLAPRTPATSPESNSRVHLSLVCPRRGLVTGGCVQEGGKCPVPAPTTPADRTEPAPRPPLPPLLLRPPPCQQTHTVFSLSRPGGIAVPWLLQLAYCLPTAVSQSR